MERPRLHEPVRLDTATEGSECTPASHSLSTHELLADVEVLSTLGSETRYETLRLVAAAEDDVCVCEIEPALDVTQGAVSQALARLSAAGLVNRRKDGRWRYYSATPVARHLLAALDEVRPPHE